nr:restriction endonuclease subunit S [Clostridium putrefaciens]
MKNNTNKYPVYSSQTLNNGLLGYYHQFLFANGITWTTDGANAGTTKYREGQFYCTNVCGVLSSQEGYANACMAEIINKETPKHVSYVGNPKLMSNVVSKISIILPPLSEQQAIASVLSDFDEHIDNLTELIEKKKAIRDGALNDLVSGKARLDGFDKEVREYKPIKSVYKRVKGTPITAGTMNEINMSTGAIRVFAGGNTECRTNSDYLSNANIIREPIVIVQSRGVIDFIYCDEPCTFKNEMWGYTSLGVSDVRFLFYYLKHNIEHFRNEGTGRSSFSQISLPVTEEYLIPVVSMKEQKEIVEILTAMDEEIESLKIEKEKMVQIKEGAMDDLLTGRVRLKV